MCTHMLSNLLLCYYMYSVVYSLLCRISRHPICRSKLVLLLYN